MKYTKIFVCCPPVVTGGPELLHQFVDELRQIGHDAYMVYYPFDQIHECPEPYRCYNAPQAQLIDEPDMLVVMPESATWIGRHFNKAQGAIWWLSVDNYLDRFGESTIRDCYAKIKPFLRSRNFYHRKMPITSMAKYFHFFQSEYARRFLERKGVSGEMMTDYLSEVYLDELHVVDLSKKKDVVCYNPMKGIKRTNKLKRAYPNIEFVPIQGLNSKGVYELLCRSKMYIDFGNHPGKDRLPREAAMARCCVLTGRRGSAANNIDVPLPDRFKLDDHGDGYVSDFGIIVAKLFSNFAVVDYEMKAYREKIRKEKNIFKKQVRDFFGIV